MISVQQVQDDFLDMMANVLETDLDGFSKMAILSKNPITINATCSVFAESEIVSLLASASKKEDIAKGLFDSVAKRITSMLRHFNSNEYIIFCGGGAKSQALIESLENTTGKKIIVLNDPQFVVAFGSAIL